jgi:hypothetical protein
MQRLINASNRTVGAKQTKKLLENGQAQVVYIAEYTASQNYHPFLIFSVGARGWRGDLSFATINIPHTKDNAHAYTNPRQT